MQLAKQNSAKVLIVDDDNILASLYRIKLQQAGFVVDVAESGEAGLLKIAQSPPDVLVLDLMLGDMNGVEVIELLRRNEGTRALPVVVFSSAFLGSLVEDALRAGANKCLNKGNCPPARLIDELYVVLGQVSNPEGPRLAPRSAGPPPMPARHDPLPVAAPRPAGVFVAPPPKPPTLGGAPAASSAPPPPAGGMAARPADEEYGTMRRDLLAQVRQRIEDVQRALPSWQKNPHNPAAPYLSAMYRAIRAVAGGAPLAGRARMGQLASGVEALLREIKRTPEQNTPSVQRTIAAGVELMPLLAQGDEMQTDVLPSPLVMIVDDDAASRDAIAAALENAHLHALSVGEAAVALKLFEWNRFDLAIFDLEMRAVNGLELAEWLRNSALNSATPLVFVSESSDLDARAAASGIPLVDLVARPINALELAVKALVEIYGRAA